MLRVLADRPGTPARFLVLGSAAPDLLRQSSESLAGRIAYHELGGLTLDEVGTEHLDALWLCGGFPLSYLAASESASALWRQQFIRTYLERDLSELGIRLPSTTMRRFWTMLAHYHGEIWNGSELARAFGVSQKTVSSYLDTLCGTFMAARLEPWHENVAKRQVKSPKIYLADSGILHTLLGWSRGTISSVIPRWEPPGKASPSARWWPTSVPAPRSASSGSCTAEPSWIC